MRLVIRWQDQQDRGALDTLVKACLPRVEYIARRYRHYPVEHDDLVSEGIVGLLTGINRFDRTRGVRLMTYASFWIRAQMVRYITADWGQGKTGIGITRTKVFFRLRRERARCEQSLMDEATMLQTLSRSFDLSERSTRRLLEALDVREFSMDAISAAGHGGDALISMVSEARSPDSSLDEARRDALFSQLIGGALQQLNERELLVIERRYLGEGHESLAVLGEILGVSRERVRQIEQAALARMCRHVERMGFTAVDLLDFVA